VPLRGFVSGAFLTGNNQSVTHITLFAIRLEIQDKDN